MSEAITCPKCKNSTMATVTFQGVDVDRCPQCKGIWFDLLEERDLLKAKGSEAVDVGARAASTNSKAQELQCPKCHTQMISLHDLRQPHIVFEKCSVCYGVFFDAGEFADLKKMSLKEYLRDLLS